MTETIPEPKAAYFKLYRLCTEQFTIDYKDKDDLYRSFNRKIDEFGIPPESVRFVDRNGYSINVKDAETLHGIVKDNPKVKVTVRSDDDHSYLSSDSVEHLPEPPNRRMKSQTRTGSKSREPRDRYWGRFCPWARFWCHPGFFHEFSHDFDSYYDQPPSFRSFGPCNFPMDPRMGFYERMRDFDPYLDQSPPFSSFKPSNRSDPRLGHQEHMRDFDYYSDHPSPFSSFRSPCYPMDPRMGYGPFCGMGRGRGGFHRGGMRGGFHG